MTNEELAILIQNGCAEHIKELWIQVNDFIVMQAGKYWEKLNRPSVVEKCDFINAGYFAMLDAVRRFDASKGSFLTILDYCLLTQFREAAGIRSDRQERDPIHRAMSIDKPLPDDPETTLADLCGDDDPELENAEHRVYVDQLHDALEHEISRLPEKEADAIRSYYWQGKTYKQIAEERSVSLNLVRTRKQNGLQKMRRRGRSSGLDQFLEDSTPYYFKGGISYFNNTHNSPVEAAVLRREELRNRAKINGL